MFCALAAHPKTATKRIVIYSGCVSISFLAAVLFSFHGGLPAPRSIPAGRGISGVRAQIQPRLVASYGKLPLSFEVNQGQTDPQVKFLSRGRGYTLFLTGDAAVLELQEVGVRSQESGARIQDSGFRIQEGQPRGWERSAILDPRVPIGEPRHLLSPSGTSGRPQRTTDNRHRSTDHGLRTNRLIQNDVLCLRLVGANPNAKVIGGDELPGKANYFIGNDPKKWRSNVPTYAKVRYQNVYPDVDLAYYGNQGGQLEDDFIVGPGADPSSILLAADAAGRVSSKQKAVGSGQSKIDSNGDLVVHMDGDAEVRFHKPLVYQEQDSGFGIQDSGAKNPPQSATSNRKSPIRNRQSVEGHFLLDAQNRIHFALGPYDHSKPLVIDPELVYSTYLGGSSSTGQVDLANGIAVDSSGNAYVIGTAYSNYIPTVNPFQASNKSQTGTVFVTKFNASGTALVYSTYLGGSGSDWGSAIAVDSAGSAYLTGQTCSSDFPTALPLQASLKGACDAFVSELNPAGTSLVYSTFLGGSGIGVSGSTAYDRGTSIAVDSSGSAYVTGVTWSTDFPTVNPIQGYGSNGDAFLCKFSADGTALIYSTYLGGSGTDQGSGIAVDSSGSGYVIGSTNSTDFPTVNPLQAHPGGTFANWYGTGFVAKMNPTGSALVYSTYLGGSVKEGGNGIAVDSSGNAYLTGATWSPDFPTVDPIETYQSKTAADNAFVAKLNSAGSALIYSTFLGGSGCLYPPGPQPGGDEALGIAIDSTGVAYVAGETCSTDFPTVNAIQASNNDTGYHVPYTSFVACLNAAGSALAYSTYLGGTYVTQANAIAVDSSGNAHVGGWSEAGFPTVNPIQAGPAGAFVVMISPPPAVTLVPTSLNFGTVLGGTTSTQQSVTLTPLSNASVSLSSIAASGDFALVTTGTSCPYGGGQVAAGATCTIDVIFTPTAADTRTGALTIIYTGQGSPQSVALNGAGIVAAANVSPTSLSFSSQDVGNSSSPQVVTLMNPNRVPLTVSTVMISSGWTQSNNCLPSVAANASCTINVSFQPTVFGPQTGTLTLADYANNSPQTVTLSGTALAPVVSLSATTLSFAAQAVSTTSAPQTVTLTNTGNGALTPLTISVSGDFAQTNTCAGSVTSGASCTISVTFTPTAAGTQTGTLTITDNAPGSPQTVQLSGSGMDFQMSSSATGQTVSPGQVANYSLTLAPEGGFNQTVSLTCSGTPSLSTCTVTPGSVTLNGTTSAPVTVKVSTTAGSLAPPWERVLPPSLTGLGRLFWLYAFLGLASLAALAAAGKRRAAYLLGACLLVVVLWSACGGGGQIIHTPGTPAGTYTLDVSATVTLAPTSSTLTHDLKLTLTVD